MLTAAVIAQFVVALDMSVVNVALPAIRSTLGFSPLGLSWVVHVYALTFGGLLLLGGRACDLYGPRRPFMIGLAVFGVCSLAGGLAQAPWQLITARAGQGLGAAAAAPATLTMLTTTFEGARRVRALGVWSAANAGGGALGVLAGGLLTEYAGWRWVMLINLPIVAAALTVAGLTIERPARQEGPDALDAVPASAGAGNVRPGSADALDPIPATAGAGDVRRGRRERARVVGGVAVSGPVPAHAGVRRERPDVLGGVLVTGGVGALVFGVVRTDVNGWGSVATVGSLAVAVLLLGGFVLVEGRSSTPLLRLGLLRSRWVAGANVLVFLAAAGQFAAFYFVSLYMQQVLGMSAAATGAAFLPFSVGVVAGALGATRVTSMRSPRTALVPGALLATAGLTWFAFISPGGGFLTDVLGPSIVTSVGVGLVLSPVAAAATTGVARAEAGMASGLLNSSRQLGGCVGLAVLATVAAHHAGAATDRAALNGGYALSLTVSAGLFLLAAVVAIVVLPRRRAVPPAPRPIEHQLEGTPS